MKFAINYSNEAAKLLTTGEIEIDYFKTPPWSDMIAMAEKLRPVKVHFDLNAGSGAVQKMDWGKIEYFLEKTATQFVNLHLEIKAESFPHTPVDALPTVAQRQEVYERMLADVLVVADHFGRENVIVENAPYHPNENHILRASVEPDLITTVIETAECGFLFDVAHARISAHYIGMDIEDYLAQLPLHRLRELHFTGIHNWEGYWMDHLALTTADWPWLDRVTENVRSQNWGTAEMLAFEYGGIGGFVGDHCDENVIADQVPRLYAACHHNSKP